MSTNRVIIGKAFREAGITEVGEVPETAEFDEALIALQDLYSSFFGNELGEELTAVNYGIAGLTNEYAIDADRSDYIDDTYIPMNSRLIFNIDAAKTLYLPPNPRPGARFGIIDNRDNLATYNVVISGNGRK